MANLGWEELARGAFPLLAELRPDAHRGLLQRMDRAFERRFRRLRPAAQLPPRFLPKWQEWPRTSWPQLLAYALVRRIFDSLTFLSGALERETPGAYFVQLSLQVGAATDGSLTRLHDPLEDFLKELDACELSRIRSCPICHRFLIAWRKDQKACSRRCANLLRVRKFRGNRPSQSLYSSRATAKSSRAFRRK